MTIKGKNINVTVITSPPPAPKPRQNQRDQENADSCTPDDRTPHEKIADQVTPLWRMEYPDQLNKKENGFKKVLNQLKRKIREFLPRNSKKQANLESTSNPYLNHEKTEDEIRQEKVEKELAWIEQL